MPESSPRAAVTYGFPTDGRTPEEVARMKEYGYGEDIEFARSHLRTDGYFCSTCMFWEHAPGVIVQKPSAQDGVCHKWNFRDRSWGCCGGWAKR